MIIYRFSYDRKRIVLAVITNMIFIVVSIWLICEPENFSTSILMKIWCQFLGCIFCVFSTLTLFSFIALLFKKTDAFVITDTYLVDNSRLESLGKIYFKEIQKIKTFKKHSLEITMKEPVFKSMKLNVLQKALLIANNWKPKSTIIISSFTLNCDRDTLRNAILAARKKKPSSGYYSY